MTLSTTSHQPISKQSARCALKISLQGRLQGIGARPAIYQWATQVGLAGQVQNTSQGIEIQIEGTPERVALFEHGLRSHLPEAACVIGERTESMRTTDRGSFSIVQDDSHDVVVTSIPVDVAICQECLVEVRSPDSRRYRYPFNSCATCGPRYSIIRRMPFEREDTVMSEFPMCEDCLAEYHAIADRRFHAQTTSCHRCGPRLWCVDPDGRSEYDQQRALDLVAEGLLAGKIVALKGLGGYQLLVDATNEQAVKRLRKKKQRSGKPFAVIVQSEAEAERLAYLDPAENHAFCSAANPIVLLKAKKFNVAKSVHPELSQIGIMLPTTAMHALLLDRIQRPLICTSGNREGDPLVFEVDEAESSLSGICDMWLHHNRPITRPIDDSVVRIIQGKPVTLRLARGLAPIRLEISPHKDLIALGGQMKASVAWSSGGSAFLSPHVGTLDNLASQQRYRWHLADWQTLGRMSADQAVADQHPGYFTSQLAVEGGSAPESVQHHHAHVAAAMIEHHLLDQTVVGVAWDGTGYGTDQTIWGGEFLVVRGNTCERFANLRPFTLPGGEAAIREPWRIAVSLLEQAGGIDQLVRVQSSRGKPRPVEIIRRIAGKRQFSPVTTSAGRLLDGLASLILERDWCEYEGQLPMMLESIADPTESESYGLSLVEGERLELDWRPLVRELLEDLDAGTKPARIAMRVHRALAQAIVATCLRCRELPIVLTGGVFQNRLLSELVSDLASRENLAAYLPGVIPPGDGGLAAGQLALASGG